MATTTVFSLLLLATLAAACGGVPCKQPGAIPKPPLQGHRGLPVNPYCPRDALKLGVCANLLGGLVSVEIGHAPTSPCCTFLEGLADAEAASCLCTALKGNVLGLNIEVPVALSALVSACQKTIPPGFKCH
ncbi:hypothetical protein DM860_000620 [Cuscuta australis]|uniref:Bifunctional inhibitor/plant lipid transfer protein/seed storage helical domain-containing protein n=1 Tax=Cuscuta australis TaxID=267555 RepID=A0A328CXP8_9ASTE|nr:hypothetical protein DM860_000620 [Cuscuta australis]